MVTEMTSIYPKSGPFRKVSRYARTLAHTVPDARSTDNSCSSTSARINRSNKRGEQVGKAGEGGGVRWRGWENLTLDPGWMEKFSKGRISGSCQPLSRVQSMVSMWSVKTLPKASSEASGLGFIWWRRACRTWSRVLSNWRGPADPDCHLHVWVARWTNNDIHIRKIPVPIWLIPVPYVSNPLSPWEILGSMLAFLDDKAFKMCRNRLFCIKRKNNRMYFSILNEILWVFKTSYPDGLSQYMYPDLTKTSETRGAKYSMKMVSSKVRRWPWRKALGNQGIIQYTSILYLL